MFSLHPGQTGAHRISFNLLSSVSPVRWLLVFDLCDFANILYWGLGVISQPHQPGGVRKQGSGKQTQLNKHTKTQTHKQKHKHTNINTNKQTKTNLGISFDSSWQALRIW